MSKLVEAAAEFLSRDTSTKQTRRTNIEEGKQIDEISLDLAKRARDKAADVVDMDYDDLRMKPFGYSEKQRVKFQKYIDKKETKKNVKEELGLGGETHKELEANNKETFHALKKNMKNNNVPHHSGEHHAAEDYGDVIHHAGHYDGHHVFTELNYEDHFGRGRVPKLNEKAVHRAVKRQNPHVSPEIHEKHANDIINFEKKFNQSK